MYVTAYIKHRSGINYDGFIFKIFKITKNVMIILLFQNVIDIY